MRVAAAAIGGLGAVVGALKGLLQVAFWLFLGLSLDWNSYVTLVVGTEGVTAVSCLLGMVGVGLAFSGRRLQVGGLLMLAGAAGVGVSTALYAATLPRLVPIDPVYPSAGYYIVSLAPALALLVGAALAFLTRRHSGSQPASC